MLIRQAAPSLPTIGLAEIMVPLVVAVIVVASVVEEGCHGRGRGWLVATVRKKRSIEADGGSTGDIGTCNVGHARRRRQ